MHERAQKLRVSLKKHANKEEQPKAFIPHHFFVYKKPQNIVARTVF
jgi:hypothetical protein